MSTKITWVTEPLYPEHYPDIIEEIRDCLSSMVLDGNRLYWYEHHEEGYVWFSGLIKNIAPNFQDWDYINENIKLPVNDGSFRKLKMRWTADDNVSGDENNLI